MILPKEFLTIQEKVRVAEEIVAALKNLFLRDNQSITMGDEGGFAPKLPSNEKALEYLEVAIPAAGYNTRQVTLGLDVAATTFFKDGSYVLEGKKCSADEMITMYENLCAKHNILSIEDGLYEEDFAGFGEMNRRLGGRINIVGDDLTVTNVELIQKAIANKSINTLLVKPNQIGTLSETLQAIRIAKENNIKIFLSHRSGETEDTFIADLAVAVGADFIKAGAPTKKERIVKYDRLIEIERQIQ
jgi:enolase